MSIKKVDMALLEAESKQKLNDAFDSLGKSMLKVKAQRDALLEAAKRVSANWGHKCGGNHPPNECSLCQLKDAIKLAEESQ